jgi:hypothetical protein
MDRLSRSNPSFAPFPADAPGFGGIGEGPLGPAAVAGGPGLAAREVGKHGASATCWVGDAATSSPSGPSTPSSTQPACPSPLLTSRYCDDRVNPPHSGRRLRSNRWGCHGACQVQESEGKASRSAGHGRRRRQQERSTTLKALPTTSAMSGSRRCRRAIKGSGRRVAHAQLPRTDPHHRSSEHPGLDRGPRSAVRGPRTGAPHQASRFT